MSRQNQLNELKTQLYESKAKEQKLQSLGLQWKQKCKSLDEEFQKAKAVIVASQSAKDVARMQKELSEAKQAVEALKKSAAVTVPTVAAVVGENGEGTVAAVAAGANDDSAAVIEGLRAELQKEKELVGQAKELLAKANEKKKQEAAKQMEELQNVQQERGALVAKLEGARKEVISLKEAAVVQQDIAKETAKKMLVASQNETAQARKELADARQQIAALQKSQTADVNVLRETVKKQNAQVAKAEEEAEAFKAQARDVQVQLMAANEREKTVQAALERCKLDLERQVDALKFASDDKQQILAEKRRQFEKLEVEKSEQLASMENKLSELASRLKGKHAALTEAVAERDELKLQMATALANLSAAKSEAERSSQESARLATEVQQLRQEKERESEGSQKQTQQLTERISELEGRVKQLEQEIVDLGLERKVSEKKSVQLIKELQTQLAKSQGPSASSTPTMQRAGGGGSGKGSRVALQNASGRETGKSAGNLPSAVGSPMRVDLNLLQEENNSLIHRITEMQQAKWKLEERIKDVEMLNRTLCEDVAQKSSVIRAYVMEVKSGGRRDMARELHKQNSFVGAEKTGSAVSATQMLAKFEEVLEDTLLKNMQLKNDMEILGNEVEELRLKNQDLQKLLGRE